jgi:hypothetical protein
MFYLTDDFWIDREQLDTKLRHKIPEPPVGPMACLIMDTCVMDTVHWDTPQKIGNLAFRENFLKLSNDSIKWDSIAWQTSRRKLGAGPFGSSWEPIFHRFFLRIHDSKFSGVLFGKLFWRSVNMCLRACQTLPFVTHQSAISVSRHHLVIATMSSILSSIDVMGLGLTYIGISQEQQAMTSHQGARNSRML